MSTAVFDINGEEIAEATPPAAPTKKRSRSKPKSDVIKGSGVVTLGERFVCTYSGRITARAVFIPGISTACFANVPCAFAWIEENLPGENEKQHALKTALCDAYEQTVETVVRAPRRDLLIDFGGSSSYEEWIGPLRFWDRLTEASGETVAEYKSRGKGTATKRGKGDGKRVTFEAAQYSISHGKGPSGCKQVNAVDGVEVEKGTKNVLTPVKALRKLQTFLNAHAPECEEGQPPPPVIYKRSYREGDGWCAIVIEAFAALADEKLLNHIATQLTGGNVYGPAVVTFTRKFSQKI